MGPRLVVKNLGIKPYTETWQAMKRFTDSRDENTADELWFVEHPRLFIPLARPGRLEHLLDARRHSGGPLRSGRDR